MEKTEGKIRYGLIGIGAQGGSYARFLTNAPAPFPGMVCAPCPDNCALGALCDIDPEKEKMCKEQYPDVPFFKDWKDMIARCHHHHRSSLSAPRDLHLRYGAWHERSVREARRCPQQGCSEDDRLR